MWASNRWQNQGERGDDGVVHGVQGGEFEEGAGFGADDLKFFDGSEAGGESGVEGLGRQGFGSSLLGVW